ncbi:uncharacterized protein LOC131027507 [Cryptomeria japonica]|uniref:uncharacterized protein LOC131027507 n=1 Tax=Cryptomeria japonica TaxID=3369 RepID=UPI0027DA3BE6|nr:uncharacterized protein LOC131027507 [Cryptomeria japonica]
MKKLVDENVRDWHKKVYEALWADRITPKRAIKMAPFGLLYGIGEKLSLPLELSAAKLQTVIKDSFFQNAQEKRVMYLMKLEEEREMLVDRIMEHQNRVKKIFDMRARPRGFLKGDEVLLWDKKKEPKGAHGKDKKPSHIRLKSNPALDFSTPRHTRSRSSAQRRMDQTKDTEVKDKILNA